MVKIINQVKLQKKLIKQASGLLGGLDKILKKEGEPTFCNKQNVAILPVSHNGNSLNLVYCGKKLGLHDTESSTVSSYNIHLQAP